MIASINGTDISGFIQESSYQMNKIPVYDEWTDGNHIKHRVHFRYRISGSFDMVFIKEADMNAFLSLVNANTSEGKLKISLRIDNTNEMKEIDAFFDLESSKKILIGSDYMYHLLSVDLEEA